MKLRSFISALVCSTLILPPVSGAEDASTTATSSREFHLVVPTDARSFQPGRFAPFHLEFRNSKLTEMKDTLTRCLNEGILPDFRQSSPVLYIYLPTMEMFEKEGKDLASEAHRQFAELFPNVNLEIRFRVLRTDINVTYIHSRVKRLLGSLKQRFARDPEAVEYVEALERSNEQAFQESQQALELTASTARKIKYGIAGARFYVVAGARTLQMLPALAQGGTPMATAMALILTDASVEFFNIAFTQQIQRWFSRFPLNANSTSVRGQVSRFINSSLWNFALFSVGRPLAMQGIAHSADPHVPAPDMDSAMNLMGWSSLGALFYAAFTDGYNTLRDKGWISASQIDMALQISGGFDLATSLLNSNPHWYWYRIFTWGPQWTFYAMVAALARVAPTRRNRILAIESSIQDWQDVHEEQVADSSWHVATPDQFNEALSRIRQLEDQADCERFLRRHLPPETDD